MLHARAVTGTLMVLGSAAGCIWGSCISGAHAPHCCTCAAADKDPMLSMCVFGQQLI